MKGHNEQGAQRLPLAFSVCDLGQVPSPPWASVSFVSQMVSEVYFMGHLVLSHLPSVLNPAPLLRGEGREDILNRVQPCSCLSLLPILP